MEINRTLFTGSDCPEEVAAYQAMQLSAFAVADQLMSHPTGTFAEIMGNNWWVSPINGKLEIIASPDSDYSVPDSCSIFMVSGFEGQGIEDLNHTRLQLNNWLTNPEFKQGNADLMNTAVAYWFSNNRGW